ncbi:hypothetical protein MMC09_001317 [Bachmanniomyces sp. S44760]|nr:hypothetical protein [Bachmanniomyces sp. S44760]
MSYYDDQPRRERSDRHKSRRDRPVVYEEEEIIASRNGPPPRNSKAKGELIRRQRSDSDLSIEEVERDFPPNGAYIKRKTTTRDKYAAPRARSDDRGGGRRDDYYGGDPRRSDTGYPGGGGRDRKSRGYDDRKSKRRDYSSDSYSSSPPRDRHRRKSLGEQALAAAGLGGVAAALTGKDDKGRDRDSHGGGRDRGYGGGGGGGGADRGYRSDRGYDNRSRSRRRGRDDSSSRSRSRSRGGDRNAKIQQAVKAALTAGAVEAFRSRKEPGGWAGDKGKRVLTAAIGAGGIDGIVDRDPNKHGMRHTAEAVIGGLAGNRLINGTRDRSRSRSRGRGASGGGSGGGGGGGGTGGIEKLVAGGAAAALGKAFLDYRERSKSRGRRHSSSDDSRSRSRGPRRSKSVTDYVRGAANKGLALAGFAPEKKRDNSGDRYSNNRRRGNDDPYSNSRGVGYPQDGGGGPRPRGGGGDDESKSHSSSDSYSSSEEERKHKKMRGKEILTGAFASVATVHAAHSVYQSVEKRRARKKKVEQGTMSPEEANKLKNKARLQDAASVGIAALGIKSAYSEWKETKEQRDECHKFQHEWEEKREKRKAKLERQHNGDGGGGGGGRGGSASYDYSRSDSNLNQRYAMGGAPPRYQDGNPYAAGALPPPPMGAPPSRYN